MTFSTRPVIDIQSPTFGLPSVRTRYSKNSLKDIGMLPRKMTFAYGRTCASRRSLLPRKRQTGFRKTRPKIVKRIARTSRTRVMKVKI